MRDRVRAGGEEEEHPGWNFPEEYLLMPITEICHYFSTFSYILIVKKCMSILIFESHRKCLKYHTN